MLNALYRLGVSGDREREEEEDARTFLDVHGRWPDEADDVRPLSRRLRASEAAADEQPVRPAQDGDVVGDADSVEPGDAPGDGDAPVGGGAERRYRYQRARVPAHAPH